jgi:hypothetical protein
MMKYVVDKEHRSFFQKEGKIEFDGIFTIEQLALLNQAIDEALLARCSLPQTKLAKGPEEQRFMAGRDLWRDQEELRKFITHGRLTETVAELVEQRPLRIGYDQLFPACPARIFDNAYIQYLRQSGSLNDMSSIEGIICGVMIPLSNPVKTAEPSMTDLNTPSESLDVFSSQMGNAVFFQSGKSIDWEHLLKYTGQRYLLIAYAQMSATYRLQATDPHTHMLKRLDYRFGDRLNDKCHLVVAR